MSVYVKSKHFATRQYAYQKDFIEKQVNTKHPKNSELKNNEQKTEI